MICISDLLQPQLWKSFASGATAVSLAMPAVAKPRPITVCQSEGADLRRAMLDMRISICVLDRTMTVLRSADIVVMQNEPRRTEGVAAAADRTQPERLWTTH